MPGWNGDTLTLTEVLTYGAARSAKRIKTT